MFMFNNRAQHAIIHARSLNIYDNLALGQYIFQNFQKTCKTPDVLLKNILYLHSSHHAITIGRSQNCWDVCNFQTMAKDDVKLVRRLEGGKATYIHKGILSFIYMSRFYPSEEIIDVKSLIMDAVVPILGNKTLVDMDMKSINTYSSTLVQSGHIHVFQPASNSCLYTYTHSNCNDTEDKTSLPRNKEVKQKEELLIDQQNTKTMMNIEASVRDVFQWQHERGCIEISPKDVISNATDFQNICRKLTHPSFLYNPVPVDRQDGDPEHCKSFHMNFEFGDVDIHFDIQDKRIVNSWSFSNMKDHMFIDTLNAALRKLPFLSPDAFDDVVWPSANNFYFPHHQEYARQIGAYLRRSITSI